MELFLIEDDSTVTFILEMQFSELGHTLRSYTSVSEFEPELSTILIDEQTTVILMDINLPNENGDQFIQRVWSQIKDRKNLYIVYLTDSPPPTLPCNKGESSQILFSPKMEVVHFISTLLDTSQTDA